MKVDKKWILFLSFGLVALDFILSSLIVIKVPYTEIDWIAYMQEVEGFLSGERNYMNLKGDTGPLVYPAGFVYVFSLLRSLTDSGVNIFKGQIIFAGFYLLVLVLAIYVYRKGSTIPWWTIVFLVLSKRIHSIFMLRMFNDCIAVLLGYIALFFFLNHKWRIGSMFYSFAVSIKMNMLLQAPGLLMLFLMELSLLETCICLFICGSIQIILGYPFLSTFPFEYIARSFDLGRVFMYKWTVNWKCIPEEWFLFKPFALSLLGLTIVAMGLFAWKWITKYQQDSFQQSNKSRKLSSHFIITTLFVSNFIGIAFARSLHYQFYVWYFHSLPYLLWYVQLPTLLRVGILAGIEVAFNVYPATWWSSLLLQICHGILLLAIFWSPCPSPFVEDINEDGKPKKKD